MVKAISLPPRRRPAPTGLIIEISARYAGDPEARLVVSTPLMAHACSEDCKTCLTVAGGNHDLAEVLRDFHMGRARR